MAASIIYEMSFKNVEDVLVKVLIADNAVQTEGDPEIIQLEPAGSPLKISTIDEGENKFTPVKSQQVTISFLSNGSTSLETFSDGADDRFSVTVLYGTTIVFYGFLSLSDNSEAFLPPKNQVVLTANDKLGALKEIPLTDFGGSVEGVNPQGKYTVCQFLAMCLQKTGLSLELRVINSLRPGAGRLTALATFTSSPNQIILAITSFFYIGQKVAVTDTALNNIVFTVTDVGQTIVTIVASDDAFVDETEVMATFTDNAFSTHFYNDIYLDAKTFEEEIGVSENCYSVLEKILGYDCFITQYKECWWICRIDEYDSNDLRVARFDENGEYIDSYIETTLSKNIGFNEDHWLSDEATIVQPMRPIGFDKLIYNFTNPLEIVCNQDFDRGDFIENLANEINEDGVSEEVKAYDFECWDSLSKEGGGQPNQLIYYDQPQIPGATLYVKKFYFNDAETNRELFIEAAPGSGAGVPYIKSQPVRVRIKDKITFSVDLSYTNIGSSTGYINTPVMIGLFADSGRIYWWKAYDVTNPEAPQEWELITTSSLVPNWYLGANVEESHSLSFTSPAIPETGDLYIYLINQYGDSIQAHYSAPEVDVLAFINGSYRNYKGRYEKVSRAESGYLANVDDEVFISDAERELFKGAMFWFNGTDYKLTVKWFDASKSNFTFPTDLTNVRPFGELQAYAVWNQYRLANRIFQYQFQGFGTDIPSLVHKYTITDVSGHSENRNFLMLTKDADLFLCNQVGVLEQVYHTEEGKIYTDEHEFKYIS